MIESVVSESVVSESVVSEGVVIGVSEVVLSVGEVS